jgi:hypothetical protein
MPNIAYVVLSQLATKTEKTVCNNININISSLSVLCRNVNYLEECELTFVEMMILKKTKKLVSKEVRKGTDYSNYTREDVRKFIEMYLEDKEFEEEEGLYRAVLGKFVAIVFWNYGEDEYVFRGYKSD